jgi:hypothetical protein
MRWDLSCSSVAASSIHHADETIFMSSFRWWPFALSHLHDPFDANVVWMPHGIDLAWVTSVPLLSVALAPVTAAGGPIVAYNLAILASPALSAWTAHLLARYVTNEFLSLQRTQGGSPNPPKKFRR